MKIRQPLCITSRLLPGVEIGGATISIEYADITSESRQAYRWFIDLHDGRTAKYGSAYPLEFQGEDLASGVGGGSLQEGLESLLVFLVAFVDAIAFQKRTGLTSENADLFPAGLADWATTNADEIGILACELEEKLGEFIIET